jgi:hypothetical protein
MTNLPGTPDRPRPAAPTRPAVMSQRLAALFVAGWLVLDFPMLGLWQGASVLGLPRLPLALFGLWAALIALLAWWMERDTDPPDRAAPGAPDPATPGAPANPGPTVPPPRRPPPGGRPGRG